MVKIYQVGGSVRDELLGIKSKDLDYSVECSSFQEMTDYILEQGGEIFLSTPEYLTIRARLPKIGAADFVMCRKDGAYGDGRRPDTVEPGTILDDLSRRDFTVNAIAKQEDGSLYDPFNGQKDIHDKFIRCVGNPYDRFMEDSLRVLRAIRFAITKGFLIHSSVNEQIQNPIVIDQIKNISQDRIREELHKCFKHDTYATLLFLEKYWQLKDVIFLHTSGIWLKPTTEL